MRTLPVLLLLIVSVALAGEETGPQPVPLVTTIDLAGHEGRVRTLAFDPTGTRLASGGPDRTLRIWSLAKRTQVASVTLPRGG